MDARLTDEQQQLRRAAAKLAGQYGPASVAEIDDKQRASRLETAVASTGWRSLRTDGASGVEVALVAEEFGRALVDAPFLGPVLADDLLRQLGESPTPDTTVAVDGRGVDAHGARTALSVSDCDVFRSEVGSARPSADLTRSFTELRSNAIAFGALSVDGAARWQALALVTTCADIVGAMRGAQQLACDYAQIREQYGAPIGSYQAIGHLLAEAAALIEGAASVLRHAAWAVDELAPDDALHAARLAKVYCARVARPTCETAIQVHGGIGHTWECLAHLYLRRVLTSSELWPARLKEVACGLS